MGTPLPLAPVHRALHATLVTEDGWDVVAAYSTPEQEHVAARSAAGLFDLSHRGRLEILGPDRAAWLHNLLTNEIKTLTPGRGCYAALLTPQGKMRGDAYVLALPDAFLLDCEASLTTTLPAALATYRITEQVELHDRTHDFGMLSIQGPKAPMILAQWAGPSACPNGELDHVTYHLDGLAIMIVRCSLTGDPGFHCIAPVDRLTELWQRLLGAGQPLGLTPCGMAALESLRIEAGRPRYGRDMNESMLLPEAGLKQAVSDTKGCYLGQEFVVRIRDRGQVNRQLALLALESPVAAAHGDRLMAGDRDVGVVTSSAVVPTRGQAMALGIVHRDCLAPGTTVTAHLAGGPCRAVVIAPPAKNV